jgi:hypothetical protein
MASELTRWFLRVGLQWLCGALLAFAVSEVEQHHHQWPPPHPPVRLASGPHPLSH